MIRFSYSGDRDKCASIKKVAEQQLSILIKLMRFQNINHSSRTVRFQDGTVISCSRFFNLSSINIFCPVVAVEAKEEFEIPEVSGRIMLFYVGEKDVRYNSGGFDGVEEDWAIIWDIDYDKYAPGVFAPLNHDDAYDWFLANGYEVEIRDDYTEAQWYQTLDFDDIIHDISATKLDFFDKDFIWPVESDDTPFGYYDNDHRTWHSDHYEIDDVTTNENISDSDSSNVFTVDTDYVETFPTTTSKTSEVTLVIDGTWSGSGAVNLDECEVFMLCLDSILFSATIEQDPSADGPFTYGPPTIERFQDRGWTHETDPTLLADPAYDDEVVYAETHEAGLTSSVVLSIDQQSKLFATRPDPVSTYDTLTSAFSDLSASLIGSQTFTPIMLDPPSATYSYNQSAYFSTVSSSWDADESCFFGFNDTSDDPFVADDNSGTKSASMNATWQDYDIWDRACVELNHFTVIEFMVESQDSASLSQYINSSLTILDEGTITTVSGSPQVKVHQGNLLSRLTEEQTTMEHNKDALAEAIKTIPLFEFPQTIIYPKLLS